MFYHGPLFGDKLSENKSTGAAKPTTEKPHLPLPYASGDDTYATVDKPKKTETDEAPSSATYSGSVNTGSGLPN